MSRKKMFIESKSKVSSLAMMTHESPSARHEVCLSEHSEMKVNGPGNHSRELAGEDSVVLEIAGEQILNDNDYRNTGQKGNNMLIQSYQ